MEMTSVAHRRIQTQCAYVRFGNRIRRVEDTLSSFLPGEVSVKPDPQVPFFVQFPILEGNFESEFSSSRSSQCLINWILQQIGSTS